MRRKRAIFLSVVGVVLPFVTACSDHLETGYKYTRLDMTLSEQHAMYADPYSQEAEEANQDRSQQSSERRPDSSNY
ncbi:MAG: hypothetical protein ABSG31_00475 [Tepidisphaeraceae bacterium]